MRIAVLGDSKGLADHVVGQALAHGHEVVALGFSPSATDAAGTLVAHAGDVTDLECVREAVGGCEAVAFVPDVWNASGAARYSEGIQNIVYAMAEFGVARLVMISAAGSFARSDSRMSVKDRVSAMFGSAGTTYDHTEEAERRVSASSLDWTIVRTLPLKRSGATGTYRISLEGALLPKTRGVSVEDAASFVLKALGGYTYVRRTVLIAD